MKISIIIPAYNEAGNIQDTLAQLQAYRQAGHEVIVADGGSQDTTQALAQPLADRVITAAKGRAQQMNAGAECASGDGLVFLHADTLLPAQAATLIQLALRHRVWGRFDVRLSGRSLLLRLVERMMNLRSHLTGIATGDQAIFVRREVFKQLGGFSDIPLMEDIALSKALKHFGHPACLRQKLTTSSRRWETNGIIRTIILMWRLRFSYWLGVAPEQLAKRYK